MEIIIKLWWDVFTILIVLWSSLLVLFIGNNKNKGSDSEINDGEITYGNVNIIDNIKIVMKCSWQDPWLGQAEMKDRGYFPIIK